MCASVLANNYVYLSNKEKKQYLHVLRDGKIKLYWPLSIELANALGSFVTHVWNVEVEMQKLWLYLKKEKGKWLFAANKNKIFTTYMEE